MTAIVTVTRDNLYILQMLIIPAKCKSANQISPDKGSCATDHESGQVMVEFALVLLFVILPFMFVLIDGSVTFYTLSMLTNAVREGARGGSIYQTSVVPTANQSVADQIAAIDVARAVYVRQNIEQMIGPLVSFSDCTTTVSYSPATPILGNPYRSLDSMTVSLACPRNLFFGLVGATQITLQGEATMRIEPGGVDPDA